MIIEKLASAIRNDVVSGLRGYHQNLSMNMELLEDEVVTCRLAILQELYSKGTLPIKDLLMSINCIPVDCESLDRCCANNAIGAEPVMHFQIPQVVYNFGKQAIDYIGSTDRLNKFTVITSLTELLNLKYKKYLPKRKPLVWVDFSPNANGMLDCFVFNAPLLQQVSVVGLFKDPRQVDLFLCCEAEDPNALTGKDDNVSFINQLVKDKLTKEKLYYYRLAVAPNLPNNQIYTSGN